MSTTPNLSLDKPTVGASSDTWGDSINANLDIIDTLYATGTFTPTDASGAGLTFSTATGIYRKAKGSVHISMKIVFPTTASGAAVNIGGLPFTSANASLTGFPISAAPVGGGTPAAVGFVNANNTTMSLFKTAGAPVANSELTTGTLYVNGSYPI